MTSLRICPVAGCQKFVVPTKLFCPHHWRMVPWAIKDVLVEDYLYGQPIEITPHSRFGRALREAKLAVEEMIRDGLPKLND